MNYFMRLFNLMQLFQCEIFLTIFFMLVLFRRTSFSGHLLSPVFQSSYTLQLQNVLWATEGRRSELTIVNSYGTMPQTGFDPPPAADTSYEADALPTKPPRLDFSDNSLLLLKFLMRGTGMWHSLETCLKLVLF